MPLNERQYKNCGAKGNAYLKEKRTLNINRKRNVSKLTNLVKYKWKNRS